MKKEIYILVGPASIGKTTYLKHKHIFDEGRKSEIKFILDQFGHRDKVSALNEIVKVDDFVQGCPMVEEEFINILNKYLKEFKVV